MPTDFKGFSLVVRSSQSIEFSTVKGYVAGHHGDLRPYPYSLSRSVPFRGGASSIWYSYHASSGIRVLRGLDASSSGISSAELEPGE